MSFQRIRHRLLPTVVALLLGATVVQGNHSGARFVFIASPATSSIYYVKVPFGATGGLEAEVLIDGQASKCTCNCGDGSDQGLKTPNSIALHKGKETMTLYVADSGAQNIYAYEVAGGLHGFSTYQRMKQALSFLGRSTKALPDLGDVRVGRQRLIVEGVEGLGGIDVDGNGNLFYAVADGQVQMVSGGALASSSATIVPSTTIYSTEKTTMVSSPLDVVADGANVYWANGAGGEIPGTVVFGPETSGNPVALAANGNSASGICRARGLIYYSAATLSLYAVHQSGGAIAEVSSAFQQPRGCAFDGESTLYVADEGGGIYSLPASSALRPVRKLRNLTKVEGPTDVAVYLPNSDDLVGDVLEMYGPDASWYGADPSSCSGADASSCKLSLWMATLSMLLVGMSA